MLSNKKSQSTLEYALLIALVVGALLGMQNYLKRSVQGKLQAAGDQISQDPYSPGLTKRDEFTTSSIGRIVEKTFKGVTPDRISPDNIDNLTGVTITEVSGASQKTTSSRELKSLKMEKME